MCERPDVAEIDALLAIGKSPGSVARERELPRSTVRVHWDRCREKGRRVSEAAEDAIALAPSLPVAATRDHPLAGTMADRAAVYEGMLTAFNALPGGASAARDRAALAPSLLRAIKDQEATLEKTQPDGRTAVERLRDNPEWAACRKVIFTTLAHFPDARAALRAALEAYGADTEPAAHDGTTEA